MKIRRPWVLVVIGFCLLLFGVLWVKGHAEEGKIKKDKTNESYFDKSFPICPKDLQGLFTRAPMDLAQIDYIIPLGMMNANSHTIPTDHMYMNYVSPGPKRIPIYAPSDLTLLNGDNKVTYYADTEKIKHADYSLEFVVCRGVTMSLTHFSELAPKVKIAYGKSDARCDTKKYHFGNDMTTYYSPCSYRLNVKVKVGELIGYIGGLDHQQGVDIGLYNHNTPPLAYLAPARYSEENLHAACPFDLFVPKLKVAYYKKIGYWQTTGKDPKPVSGQGYFVPRTVEPICGQDMYDIEGTARGNWFAGTVRMGSVTQTQYMMALAPFADDPTKLKISIKGPESLGSFVDLVFLPVHQGQINRDFAEVRRDGKTYCYQDPNGPSYSFLIQVLSNSRLRIEREAGSCGPTGVFKNPFTFLR